MLNLIIEEIKLNFHLSHWHVAEIKIVLLYNITKGVREEVILIHH